MSKSKILVFIVLIIIFLIFGQLTRGGFNKILLPFRVIAQTSSQTIQRLVNINDIIRKNSKLKTQNSKLISELVRLKEIEQENKLLREQIQISDKDWDIKLVPVIGLNRFLLIDYNDPGIVIAAGNILVGKTSGQGKVLLTTDPESEISGLIQEVRVPVAVKGNFGTNLFFDFPLSENRVKPGQLVITSQGLIIGKIKDVEIQKGHISQRALVEPSYRTKELEKVFIITNF